MVAAPLPAPLPVFSLQGTRSLRVIRTQHPSGSGGSPGESWVCGRSPSASKWSPSAGSEGPGLGQTVEGRGREGSLGDLAWEGKAGWAPLRPVQLIPQRSFWHISGCRGSNCARTTPWLPEVGSSWPATHAAARTASHSPCSRQDTPLANPREDGTDTPSSGAFPAGGAVAGTGLGTCV